MMGNKYMAGGEMKIGFIMFLELVCESLAVAVAGGQLKAGAGRHAEREGALSGREGKDCEGCSHLSLCEMAASDSGHPMCWCSVLRNQRCTFSFPLHSTNGHSPDSVFYLTDSSMSLSRPAVFLRL